MIERLSTWLMPPRPAPAERVQRIAAMQLHIVIPAKLGVAIIALHYLFSGWFSEEVAVYILVVGLLRKFFLLYILCNIGAALTFLFWRRFPLALMQWLVFTMGLLDGIFLGGLSFLTGGFESIAYWIFPALIVLNAISIPLAAPQIVLNLLLSLFYLGAGVLTNNAPMPELSTPPLKAAHLPAGEASSNHGNKPFLVTELPYMTTVEPVPMGSIYPRLFVLWLLTACCYGLQLLVVRQQEAMEEAREFALREGQLRSAGRLAAEFAHQIKNPLAVINSTAFSLQRSLGENANEAARKIHIIQEEVERADRVITQIMGYAQLTEGRVERLNVIEEVDRAIARIFPPALPSRIKIHREYARDLPPLLMQRIHLSDILLNLLKNAREALGDAGKVFIAVRHREDNSVEVSIRDEGPGIAADKMTRIFESYYTTKEKGTGLGLSIVKRNVELYGGAIRAKSEIGKGAEFILTFPAKATASLSPQTKET